MFFRNCKTVTEIKKLYRKLALEHHPDRGGSNAMMKKVNEAYEAALKAMHGHESRGSDGKMHTYYYNEATEREAMRIIQELLKLRMANVDIMLIGTWIWVKGDTKPHKEQLNDLGLRWSGRRVAWYWRKKAWGRRPSPGSLASIAAAYGVEHFEAKDSEMVAA